MQTALLAEPTKVVQVVQRAEVVAQLRQPHSGERTSAKPLEAGEASLCSEWLPVGSQPVFVHSVHYVVARLRAAYLSQMSLRRLAVFPLMPAAVHEGLALLQSIV